jgi:subtilisin family serine protease
MIEINGTNTSFDAWSGDALFTNLGATSPLIDGNTNVTVGEIGGTSNSIISVGAFTSKNEYTDIQGNTQYAGFYTGVGEIAPFSSLGPTADGRTKPDITAPGNVIISSVSSFDSTYNDSHPKVVAGLNDGTNDWFFASMQGTSMSSPMVTGIVALWLQANPALTPTEIKQFMQVNASLDSFTGSIPNNTWGFGKIDAHSTLQEIESSLNVQDYNDLAVKVYPNPTDSYLFFEGIENPIYISVYNMLGKKVLSAKETHSINVKELSNGVYFIRISDGKDQTNIKFLKN